MHPTNLVLFSLNDPHNNKTTTAPIFNITSRTLDSNALFIDDIDWPSFSDNPSRVLSVSLCKLEGSLGNVDLEECI